MKVLPRLLFAMLLIYSRNGIAEVFYLDPSEPSTLDEWTIVLQDDAALVLDDNYWTLRSAHLTPNGSNWIQRTLAPFDNFVVEAAVWVRNVNPDSSPCSIELNVSGLVDQRVRQARVSMCGAAVRVATDPAEQTEDDRPVLFSAQQSVTDGFVVFRLTGSLSKLFAGLSHRGDSYGNWSPVLRSSSYPYTEFFAGIGETTTRLNADFSLAGLCVATNGDDCFLGYVNDAGSLETGLPIWLLYEASKLPQ